MNAPLAGLTNSSPNEGMRKFAKIIIFIVVLVVAATASALTYALELHFVVPVAITAVTSVVSFIGYKAWEQKL